MLRTILRPVLRLGLDAIRSVTLLQNKDDLARLEQLGYVSDNAVIIRGSGIDTNYYEPQPFGGPTSSPLRLSAASSKSKGVRVLVEAHRRLRRKGLRVRLLLVGKPDNENPGAISREEIEDGLRSLTSSGSATATDIRSVWARADIAVLPSIGGEGLPKALLEAAACGRPFIATDVPGSREIAIDGRNAIMVPPSDAEALCDALERLAGNQDLRKSMGAESRRIVESDMAQEHVSRDIVLLYRKMIDGPGPLSNSRVRDARDPRCSRDHGSS